jgi:hypothetical protein
VPLGEDLLYADQFARWGLPVVVAARSGWAPSTTAC